MPNHEFRELVEQGAALADGKNTLEALIQLEKAAFLGSTPVLNSYLGYCLAIERRQFKKAASLCSKALKEEPGQATHYLNLGRVYLAAGQKAQAIKTLRQGLKRGRNRYIVEELRRLGIRKQPIFSSLSRRHPLNKHAGVILTRLGMR